MNSSKRVAGVRGWVRLMLSVCLGFGLPSLAGCRRRPVPIVERVVWRCVPVEFASINARAEEIVMFLPGDEAHSFRLVAPDICRELTAKAKPLAEVEFWVRGTKQGGVKAWHPETINGKNYEVLGGAEGSVPPALQAEFTRVQRAKR